MEHYTKSMESTCALTKTWKYMYMYLSVVTQHLVKPLVVTTASSVNCVTVSNTDVSVPARKKTKLSTKLTKTSYTECICYSFFFEDHTEMSNV